MTHRMQRQASTDGWRRLGIESMGGRVFIAPVGTPPPHLLAPPPVHVPVADQPAECPYCSDNYGADTCLWPGPYPVGGGYPNAVTVEILPTEGDKPVTDTRQG